MTSSDDVVGFDSPTLFDSFEEMELHPLERHRTLKSKRSRDGENTRVRSKGNDATREINTDTRFILWLEAPIGSNIWLILMIALI